MSCANGLWASSEQLSRVVPEGLGHVFSMYANGTGLYKYHVTAVSSVCRVHWQVFCDPWKHQAPQSLALALPRALETN